MAVAHPKEVWSVLLCVAEAVVSKIEKESAVAVEAVVEEHLPHYPQLTPPEVKFVRQATFDLSRFEALCDGAFQGYCSCFKRNSSHKAAMYLIAYLFIFSYRTLGESAICELLHGRMPDPRLCEYVQYLATTSLLTQFSAPLWRTTYDDSFLQQHVMTPLATASKDVEDDAAGWLQKHTPSAMGPSPHSLAGESTVASTRAPRSTATSTVNNKTTKEESCPPQLHTSARIRPLLNDRHESVLSVREPRLPRIKDAPLFSHPRATKAPTKPVGFAFHQRDAAAAATDAVSSTTSATRGTGTTSAAAGTTDSNYIQDAGPRRSSAQLRRILNTSRTVPTTIASLRREACMRDRQRGNAEKALTEMEVVARDAAEYELWRQAQEEEEEREREMNVMQRHLDAIETEERVRAKRANAAEIRRRHFNNLRYNSQEALEARKLEEDEALRRQAESVQQQRAQQLQARQAALEKSSAAKATLVAQVKQESDELRVTAQEEEEERQTQHALLIQEIHVMRQRIREQRARMGEERRRAWADGEADAALGRMSVAELRDALERVRAEDAAEVAARHDYVTTVRARAQAERDQLEEECTSAREQQRQCRRSKQAQRAQHKAAVEAERASWETTRMMQLHEKLEAKRQEAREVQRATREAERQRRNVLLLRAQDSTSMEQGRWNHYEAGLVRRSKWEQQRTLQEAQK